MILKHFKAIIVKGSILVRAIDNKFEKVEIAQDLNLEKISSLRILSFIFLAFIF